MIGKFLCWWKQQHRRGKFLRAEGQIKVYACPRCQRETRYKQKAAA